MTLIIAGERSGVGKTTVTLALLSSLCRKYRAVQSFKVGPDYIDPMFHQRVTGRPCRNLDAVLTSEKYVQECYQRHLQGVDYALIEGVMGLFDGASGRDDKGSTANMARLLELPVLLVLDCSRVSRSIAAIAFGYQNFDPRIKIAGVVLNRVGSDRHLELLKDALEPLHLPILGVLRRQDNITIPDRHLGLVPTEEMPQMAALIERFAELGDSCFDWQRLLPLLAPDVVGLQELRSPPAPLNKGGEEEEIFVPCLIQGRHGGTAPTVGVQGESKTPIRIAVARDRAFSFYYQDNL
ncbi:MAG: cobyrinate a,c-diamide synthase, partial [Coleofasciculaceae cyanobacterium]